LNCVLLVFSVKVLLHTKNINQCQSIIQYQSIYWKLNMEKQVNKNSKAVFTLMKAYGRSQYWLPSNIYE